MLGELCGLSKDWWEPFEELECVKLPGEGELEETLASSSSELCQLSSIRGRVGAFVPADPWLGPARSTAPRALQTDKAARIGVRAVLGPTCVLGSGVMCCVVSSSRWSSHPCRLQRSGLEKSYSEGTAQQVWAAGGAWGLLHRLAGRDGLRAAGGLVSPCEGPVGGLRSSL